MTTGFKNAAGEDFDSLFDPYVEGMKPAVTGFKTSDGVDLNQRYAPILYGAQQAATGFKIASGADVNTLWAKIGTAAYLTNVGSGAEASTGPLEDHVKVRIYDDGRIVFAADNGGTIYYDSGAGTGSLYDFRISGSITVVGASSGIDGKGGVHLVASGSYDTGWQAADPANDFLDAFAKITTTTTQATRTVDGTFDIQVRRKSDGVVVREWSITFNIHIDVAN